MLEGKRHRQSSQKRRIALSASGIIDTTGARKRRRGLIKLVEGGAFYGLVLSSPSVLTEGKSFCYQRGPLSLTGEEFFFYRKKDFLVSSLKGSLGRRMFGGRHQGNRGSSREEVANVLPGVVHHAVWQLI